MKKSIITFLTLLTLNVCLYSQMFFPPTIHDFNPGPDGSGVFLPAGGYPNYSANGIPSLYPIIPVITFNNPAVYNVNGSSNTLLNLPDPSSGPATSYNFPIIQLPYGRENIQPASNVFNSYGLVASSNASSATISIIIRPTAVLISSIDVLSESQLTEIPPLFPQESPGIKIVGINNTNNFPTFINLNENTNQINLTPLTDKPVGNNYTPLIRPEIIEEPQSNKLINGNNSTNANVGYVFYSADDGINGIELWITDGTIAGTHMVKDIYPTDQFGNSNSFPNYMTPMNNKIYFVAAAPGQNSELWVSDGTELGTNLVKDINSGFGNSNISGIFNINNMLYFGADNGNDGRELWKSDGTTAGTVMIKEIYPGTNQYGGPNGSSPHGFTLFNGLIYFAANDGINGRELWVTDGTPENTKMVKNINNTGDGSAGSSPIMPGLPNGDVFYFYAEDGIHGKELWVSDGTADGTKLGYDIYPGPSSSNNWSGWGVISNGTLYASADDGVVGNELFVFENAPTSVPMASLSLKVFLEGSYVSNSMSTNLTSSIPLSQPFNNPEGNYYGDESISSTFSATHNIVDWVVVELRTGTSASEATTVVVQKAVLVNSNGDLVDLDGSLDIDFKWVEAGDYYVSVYHRNHLKIMSSGFVTLTN